MATFTLDTGANASAEEAEETLEDEEVKVNNIIHSFSYQKTSFDKKSYSTYIKCAFGVARTHGGPLRRA
jgi:hypothetical protein